MNFGLGLAAPLAPATKTFIFEDESLALWGPDVLIPHYTPISRCPRPSERFNSVYYIRCSLSLWDWQRTMACFCIKGFHGEER